MRRHEDALRSFKRYLALAMRDGTPQLAAAKFFPDPDDFDPEATYDTFGAADFEDARRVWFDLGPAGTIDAAPVDAPADPAALGLVFLGHWEGRNFYGNPPGLRLDSASMAMILVSPDVSAVSPSLVEDCAIVSGDQWAEVLAAERWGDPATELEGDSGRTYRLAKLVALPASLVTGSLGAAVTADDLPAPVQWQVRYFHDHGEMRYPAVIVKPVGGAQIVGRPLYAEVTQAFTIYAYPARPDEANVSVSEIQVGAEKIRDQLAVALVQSNRNGAAPMRLPLYDYEGIPVDQPAGRRLDTDFLKVVDASVDVMPEPTNPKMAVVIADVRLNWRVSLDTGRGATIAEELRLALTTL